MAAETNDALEIIFSERRRQLHEEKMINDDGYICEELPRAAAAYALAEHRRTEYNDDEAPAYWPWSRAWWKPKRTNRVRELAIAGALIVAEIERILRRHPARGLKEPQNVMVVGGYKDGQWIAIDPKFGRIELQRRVQQPNFAWDDPKAKQVACEAEVYHLDNFTVAGKAVWFLRHERISSEEAVNMILRNYRPASSFVAASESIESFSRDMDKLQAEDPVNSSVYSWCSQVLRHAKSILLTRGIGH